MVDETYWDVSKVRLVHVHTVQYMPLRAGPVAFLAALRVCLLITI